MSPNAESVRAALATLVFRAGVLPDDSPDRQARKVCEVLRRDHCAAGVHEASSPSSCPLARWIVGATDGQLVPGTRLLVTTHRVVASGPWIAGACERDNVPLPAAAVAALVLIAERRGGLVKPDAEVA